MFKTINIFRITTGWKQEPDTGTMDDMADAMPFTPCAATQDKSVGWVPPRGEDHGALVESINGHRIMKLMIETKSVPSATVKKKAQEAADHIEATTGRKPGKKEMKELREDALTALLPQAFPKQTAVLVWFDFAAGLLMTDASSQGKSDEVITALVRTFDGLALMPMQTKTTPQAAMTAWLSSEDAEEDAYEMHGLTIERACELRSADEEKSVVKFNRHNIVNDQVRQHIAEGKLPRWTALSWEDRIGFVLTEAMQIKKISYLEGVFDDRQDTDADGFDADVALATGELSKLIPELVEALGGEFVPTDMEQK